MIFNFYKSISNKYCSLIDNIDKINIYYHVYNEDDDKFIEKSIYLDSEKLDICLRNISHNTIIEILQKTNSERVKKLAENIVSTQEAEINYMKQLLQSRQ